MAKNQQNGVVQPLDSEATQNSQPNKLFIPGAETIEGADPDQPSTNPATRREKYNAGSDIIDTPKQGKYNTVTPVVVDRGGTQDSENWNQFTGYIKKLKGNSFITEETEKYTREVMDYLQKNGIDATSEVYGPQVTNAIDNMIKADLAKGEWTAQANKSIKNAPNIQLVNTLTKETWMAIAQGKTVSEIAEALGQDERVIQKIVDGKQNELIQLSQEYEDEQMRQYLRYKEDLDTQIARNIAQYQNVQTNLDYQFDSAIKTLERSLFDSEWTARGTAAGMGMTGTKYLLDRIKTQYQQQRDDLQNTYDYQSANAQMAINNALEDYTTNINRWMEDYATQIKGIQDYVMQEYLTSQSNILTADQKISQLLNLKKTVEEMKANAIIQTASLLESGNEAAAQMIANAYGLGDLTTTKFTDSMLNRGNFKTVGESTNSIGNILASNDGIRIGTYTNPKNGYTYNVYATREDGLNAAKQLLHGKRYRGKTMKEIAQTWTGNSNPTTAWAVMQEEGLNLSDVLTEENIDKLLIAMGRREGTLQKGQTLDDWINGGQDLSSYKPQSSVGGVSTEAGDYFAGDTGLYEQYLAGKNISSIMAAVKKNSDYGATETERVTNFTRAAQAYQRVASKNSAGNMIKSLSNMAELKNSWDNLSDAQKKEIGTIGLSEWGQNYLIGRSNLLGGGKMASVFTKYATVSAQGFIDTLVDSKKEGAAYGQLSDKEGDSLRSAWSSLSLKNPNEFGDKLDDMINNIVTNLKELGYTDEEIAKAMGTTNLNPQQTSTTFNTTGRYGSGQTIGAIPGQ